MSLKSRGWITGIVALLSAACGTAPGVEDVDEGATPSTTSSGSSRAPHPAGSSAASQASSSVEGTAVHPPAQLTKCGPTPRELAPNPVQFAIHGTSLFYSSLAATSAVLAMPLTGGPSASIGSGTRLVVMAATSNDVLFMSGDDSSFSAAPVAGGPTVPFPDVTFDNYLAVDDDNIYFTDADGTEAAPLAGGPKRLVTKTTAYSAVASGGSLTFTAAGAGTSTEILTIPTTGGTATTVATGLPEQIALIACGSHVCWNTPAHLLSIPPPGKASNLYVLDDSGKGRAVMSDSDGNATLDFNVFIVSDGTDFFWASGDTFGGLYRVPLSGGPPTELVNLSVVGTVAVDDECVYWSNTVISDPVPGAGIYSLAKTATGGPFQQ